jgi:hypothetical protein
LLAISPHASFFPGAAIAGRQDISDRVSCGGGAPVAAVARFPDTRRRAQQDSIMATIQGDTVLVDQPTTKLQGFRLEDTVRAPAIILFIDEEKPQLLPMRQGITPPTKIRSHNMEADILIITYGEINAYLNPS